MTKHETNVAKRSTLAGAALALAIATLPATAGSDAKTPIIDPPSNSGDWCTNLKSIGKVYENKDSGFIQGVKFFGRLHLQYAYLDGDDINGNSFSDEFETVRRFRLGTEIKFLNGFSLMGRADVATDAKHGGGTRDWGFQNWDELKLSYTKKDVAGFDKLTASYGRHKIGMGLEARMSSKKIKTIERTAISNKIFSNRYTGLLLSAEKGNWAGTIGYLSLDSTKEVGNWSHGNAIYLLSEHKLDSGTLSFDLFYNLDADSSGDDEVGVGYEWTATVSYVTDVGNWNLLTQAIYGDNGDTSYAGRK
ncbi:MAG: porin, partial [Akkermansiaceae bacterium]